jgi:lysophospholipase L1-like esterase
MRGYRWSLIGALLALACIELLVRQTLSVRTISEPDYVRVNAPGTAVWGREGHGVSHWDAHGIRSRASGPAHENKRAARVLVLGDSVTEALQVDDAQTFVQIAELKLGSHALPAVVQNAGRSSFSVADHVLHAARHRRLFAPDWVVVVVQENDFTTDAFDVRKSHFEQREGKLEVVPVEMDGRLDRLFRRWDGISSAGGYALVRAREFRAAFALEAPLFHEAPHRAAAVAKAIEYPVEEEVALLAKAYATLLGPRITILFLPEFTLGGSQAQESEIERRVRVAADTMGARFVTPRPAFAELQKRRVVPYGFANLEFNAGHLNPEGHAAVGETLAREISDALF